MQAIDKDLINVRSSCLNLMIFRRIESTTTSQNTF